MLKATHIPLPNGWTASIGPDTPPALCSVAAFPTEPPNNRLWLEWPNGQIDRRCWLIEDVCEALEFIQAAPPPDRSRG